MKHKLTALLLSAAAVFSLAPYSASADAEMVITAGSVTASAEAGTKITVPVRAESNPGYAAGTVTVFWDRTALTLDSVTYTKLAPKNSPAASYDDGFCTLCFGNYLAEKNYTGTGTLCKMNFTVAENALPGEYPIMLDYADIADVDAGAVGTVLNSGIVSLEGEIPDGVMQLRVGTAEAEHGDSAEIRVPVYADANPGFVAGKLDLLWDAAALTLQKVDFSKGCPDNGSPKEISSGMYTVAFGSYLREKDRTAKGVLFTLVFTQAENAEAGVYSIMIADSDIVNADVKQVPVTAEMGAVILAEKTTAAATTTTEEITTVTESETESTTTTTATTVPAEIVTTTTVTSVPEEIATTTTATTVPAEIVTTTTATSEPAEIATTTTATTVPAEIVTTTTAATVPAEIVTTTATTVPAEIATTTTVTTVPADIVTTTTATSEPAEIVTTTTATSVPAEIVTTTVTTEPAETGTTTTTTDTIERDKPTAPTGDCSGNGTTELADAVLLLRFITEALPAKDVPAAENLRTCDLDADGILTVSDVSALLRLLSAGK